VRNTYGKEKTYLNSIWGIEHYSFSLKRKKRKKEERED
jgi:hypothetical protein